MVNLVKFARAAPCTKPIMWFAVTATLISFIFVTVIVTSGLQPSSRGFYLVSFEYNLPDTTSSPTMHRRADPPTSTLSYSESALAAAESRSSAAAMASATNTASTMPSSSASSSSEAMPSSTGSTSSSSSDVQTASRNKFRDAVEALLTADEMNSNMTFNQVRVSYHGVCVQIQPNGTRDDSWRCGNVKSTRTLAQMTGGDPFDLVDIGAYYKDKMAFALPWWFAVPFLGIATMALLVGSLPLIPSHPMVNRVAAVCTVVGSGSLLVGLLLTHVTSNAVVTLTELLTVGTVTAHIGRTNQIFGWTAFALSFLAALGISIIVIGELALLQVERRSNAVIDHAVNKGMDRLPFSNPVQHMQQIPSPAPSQRGLGRTMGGVGLDDLRDLAKAKSRQEALFMVAGKISTKKGDNMV